jgi:hypothetical protein
MGLIDSIIGVESGGNPNATNPNSSATGLVGSNSAALSSVDVSDELRAHVLIGKLLFASSPSAVFGRVIATPIWEAVKGMIGARSRSHICKKVFEVVPALANFNALRSIVLVRNMVGESAPAAHTVPNLIFGSGLPAAGFRDAHAVRGIGFFDRLGLVASATLCIPRPEVGDRNYLLRPTVAHTKHPPSRGAAVLSNLWFCLRNRGQLAELHSNAIYGGCH